MTSIFLNLPFSPSMPPHHHRAVEEAPHLPHLPCVVTLITAINKTPTQTNLRPLQCNSNIILRHLLLIRLLRLPPLYPLVKRFHSSISITYINILTHNSPSNIIILTHNSPSNIIILTHNSPSNIISSSSSIKSSNDTSIKMTLLLTTLPRQMILQRTQVA